jgi:hypothetical protein
MNKHMTATLLCSAMATLLASPAYALEFVRKDRLGAGAMSYLLPSLSQGVTSRAQERPEPKTLSEKQVEAINKGRVELPKCTRAEGSMRIVEPDDGQALWASYGLPMPTRMLRSFVTESSCWTVLDRGWVLPQPRQSVNWLPAVICSVVPTWVVARCWRPTSS